MKLLSFKDMWTTVKNYFRGLWSSKKNDAMPINSDLRSADKDNKQSSRKEVIETHSYKSKGFFFQESPGNSVTIEVVGKPDYSNYGCSGRSNIL